MGVEWGSPPAASRRGYSPHRPGSEWEDIFGVLLAVLAALVAGVLVTGHASALALDGSFPRYRLVDAPTVLGGVAASPDDPGRAWDPVNSGGRPPGPVAFYATAGVLAAAGAGLLLAATRGPRPARADGEGIEWATRRQRRALRVRAGKGRLVVGRAGRVGELLAIERGHSLLVLGATRSGKTTGLAIPAILEWPGPVLCTSTKGDLVDHTAGYRSTLGRVQVFDPSAATSFPGSSWTPMARSATWEGAMADAHALAEAGKITAGAGLRMAGLWYAGAQKLLAPYLFAAARTGRTITDVARWIDIEDHDHVAALIADEPDAATAHEATFLRSGDSRSSLFQVCQQMLAVYLDPVVARSATHSEIEAADFFDGAANTMYVTAPIRDQERFETVFSTIVKQFIDAGYDHVAATGKPLDPPWLLVLDEAANIAPINGLDKIVSTASAMGMQLVTVCQDLAQLEGRYDAAAKTIINNHRGLLVLPGCKDVDTLNLASQLIGDHSIDRPSVTRQGSGQHSSTTGSEWRPLLAPALARTLDDGDGVLVYGNTPPAKIRLRPWYRSRRLRHLARTTPRSSGSDSPMSEPPDPDPSAQTPHDHDIAAGSSRGRVARSAGLADPLATPGLSGRSDRARQRVRATTEPIPAPSIPVDAMPRGPEPAPVPDEPTAGSVIELAHHQARRRRGERP